MAEARRCPQCGSEVPLGAPQGLCPKCLLEAAQATQDLANLATVDPLPSPGQGASADPSSKEDDLSSRVGQEFGGYRILRHLGRGGMGSVYEAEHSESGRRVALKILSHRLDSPEARKRFLREGRLAAAVNHPNSVYVFGSEEIDGIPVISMELISGGTLEDRVKEAGPLPIPEAVDSILQVIAGLECAHAGGVLHRDIKPSNCFVDADGAVKVGDFGLSISTLTRAESNITVDGTFLGTPAFASPEQLRGDALDVRSDIYAVGVTLYYLLTGKTPFEADNVVKLIATVLDQPAKSPKELRPDIPKVLAHNVLRCIAKQSERRFKSYEELRRALLPFSSTTPESGSLRLRSLAAAVDYLTFFATYSLADSFIFEPFEEGSVPAFAKIRSSVMLLVWVLYFAVPEGIWGASVGKALCGLRVAACHGGVAGVPKALLRSLVYVLFPSCFVFVFVLAGMISLEGNDVGILLVLAYLILFSSARRKNGFAGLHELLTKTRVIVKSTCRSRPAVPAQIESLPASERTTRVGPYHVLDSLSRTDTSELLLGYDGRLLRRVWIRRQPPYAPPVPQRLRNLDRPGRLRWLGGRRSKDESWDAYEAPSGKPLLSLVAHSRTWNSVRYWLLDLAEELEAGAKQESLPSVLSLDRVWITSDGRAKLLDFAGPPVEGQRPYTRASLPPGGELHLQRFLLDVAVTSLQGVTPQERQEGTHSITVPVPLHAREFLTRLETFENLGQIIDQLKSLLKKRAVISPGRRLTLIGTCWLLAAVLIILPFMVPSLISLRPKSQLSVESLRPCLERLQTLQSRDGVLSEEGEGERHALEVYIAGHSGRTTWSSWYANVFFSEHERMRAARIARAHRDVTKEGANDAAGYLKLGSAEPRRWTESLMLSIRPYVLFSCIISILIPILLPPILLRRGMLLDLLGIAVVNRQGTKAGRLRMFWRSLVAWSPLVLSLFFVFWPVPLAPQSAWVFFLLLGVHMVLFGATAAWSVVTPGRSLQDRIAGTSLVPL